MGQSRRFTLNTRTPRAAHGEMSDMTFTLILAGGAAVAASILALPVTMPSPIIESASAPAVGEASRDNADRRLLTALEVDHVARRAAVAARSHHPEDRE
ncbi:hypothetical protein ACW9UR_16740 [Halovulum sp. GXIMD14794]